MTKTRYAAVLPALALLMANSPALAHHAMDGATPDSFLLGFISGVAHPVIGIDHLAFVAAAGVAAAFMPRRFLTPLAFVGATLIGCMIAVAGGALPLGEIVIALSVMLAGGLALSGRAVAAPIVVGFFGLAGLFHGAAYGASIVGAEASPLVAYLLGFGLIQYAIAVAVGQAARMAAAGAGRRAVEPRLAGAVAAGVGFAFLIENVEAMLFA